MEVFKYKKPLALMEKSKRFGILSLVVLVMAIGLILTKGFNYGIDFAGGTLVQVQYEGKAPIKEIRSAISQDEHYESATVTYFGSDDEVVIRTKTSSEALGEDVGDKMRTLLKDTGKFEVRRVDMVGAKVGSELREKGLMAMLLAIIGILIYVSFRFEWRFAVASVMALIHDVTLSRTTLTSLTTFFVVFTLWMFGGEIIHGFGFTLLVGIIVGTYSSIFVASPILMWLGFSVTGFREKEAAKLKREKEKEKMRAMYENGTI